MDYIEKTFSSTEYLDNEELYECDPYPAKCVSESQPAEEDSCKKRDEISDELAQLEDKITALWSMYEEKGLDVFMHNNVDIVANIIESLSPSLVFVNYAKELFDKIMTRLQRGIHMEPLEDRSNLDAQKLAAPFSVLGEAIIKGTTHAQISICSILSLWLENVMEKRHPERFSIARRTFLRKLMKSSNGITVTIPDNILIEAFEESLLPKALAKFIRDEPHTEGFGSILSLLRMLCDASSKIRESLWSLPVLDPALLKLSALDPTHRMGVRVIEFVEAYFGITPSPSCEQAEKQAIMIPPVRKESFQILLVQFIRQMKLRTTRALIGLRNDLGFLICLIAKRVPRTGEFFQEFGMFIAAIVSNTILKKQDMDPAFILDSSPMDLELLQYMIYMLQCIVEQGDGEKIVNEYSIAAVLLRWALGPCELGEEAEKKNDLDKAVWSTIKAIAKHCPLSLLTPQGVPSLLAFLIAYGEVGEGDQATLAMCLQTLRIMLTTAANVNTEAEKNDEAATVAKTVMDYFIQRDVMTIILNVLKLLALKENEAALQDTCISNALHSCGALGFYDLQQKMQFARLEGVTILVAVMRCLYLSSDKRRRDAVIQIAISECICGCVAYCAHTLEEFLAYEGLFRLLEIVEISEGPVAPSHLMNCVLHICDYPRCMDQLLYYHRPLKCANQKIVFGYEIDVLARMMLSGADFDLPKSRQRLQELCTSIDQTLASLLCALWKDEERRFEVLRDPDGCIASFTHPLMSKFARNYERGEQTGIYRSCLDVTLLSLRQKIFLLIKQIVEVTRTEATLFDDLSLPNQVVMESIVNFVDLKKSEIYLETIEEMQSKGYEIESTAMVKDNDKVLNVSKNTIATVLESQRCLIRTNKEKDTLSEYEFYRLMKFCKLQDHLAAAKELDHIVVTTNYPYLVEKRLWQKSELETVAQQLHASFVNKGNLHRTSDGNLNITAWTSRTKMIDSEGKIIREFISLEDYEDNGNVGSEEEEETAETVANSGEEDAEEHENEDTGEKVASESGKSKEVSETGTTKTSRNSQNLTKSGEVSATEVTDDEEETESSRAADLSMTQAALKRLFEASDLNDSDEDPQYLHPEYDLEMEYQSLPEDENMGESWENHSPVPLPIYATPEPKDGAVYKVPRNALFKALEKVEAFRKRYEWGEIQDSENSWFMRTKWKPDWYPVNQQ